MSVPVLNNFILLQYLYLNDAVFLYITVYGAPESSEMSKKPQKLKDSLIGNTHIHYSPYPL